MNEPMNAGVENSAGHACHDSKCGKKCGCVHHMVIPTLIILIGLDLLLGALSIFSSQTTTIILAVIIILIGTTKLKSKMCKCC